MGIVCEKCLGKNERDNEIRFSQEVYQSKKSHQDKLDSRDSSHKENWTNVYSKKDVSHTFESNETLIPQAFQPVDINFKSLRKYDQKDVNQKFKRVLEIDVNPVNDNNPSITNNDGGVEDVHT